MNNFIEQFCMSLKEFDQPIIKIPNEVSPVNYDFITSNKFFPTILKKEFRKQNRESRMKFKVKNTVIDMIILSKDDEDHMSFFSKYIANCIRLIEGIFKKQINGFQIVLALIDKPRSRLPKNKHLDTKHVNSGLCVSFNNSPPLIFIYRRQEICKVIVHELLHAYHIHPFSYPKEIDTILIKKYNIELRNKESLNVFEAYVECMAIILNSLLFDEMFKTKNTLEKEIAHQIYTVNQLNKYKPYSQSTNVFAYVYLKTYLLCHIDSILKNMEDTHYCIYDTSMIIPEKRMIFKKINKNKFNSTITLNKMDIFKTYLKLVQS